MSANHPPGPGRKIARDAIVAACCGVCVAAMVGAAYASVPLYRLFCQVTGFGGTPVVSERAPDHVLGRTLTIRFDSNVMPGLPWTFEPEQNEIKLRIGEVATVHYKVTNQAARETAGQAAYNVTPPQVGAYFAKINCFCFTQQSMKAGETRDMTVVFYVDPALAKDSEQNDLNTITLSYTFFRLPDPERPVADAAAKSSSKL
jgi:cytochrome c oxidase assembly protein subunit 11